jgi:2-C-methyl-D-erythritol 4-phosphate cytidylyltransferase
VEKKRCTAILLAAGSGRRMQSGVAKQYMLLQGKPILWYSLNAIEESSIINDCILVTGAEDIKYVENNIVEQYHFHKVDRVIAGGAERYDSVCNALEAIADGALTVPNKDGYVFIHDAARPFLTEEIIGRCYRTVAQTHACVAGMPVKDTIKLADTAGYAASTPDRSLVWQVQTPQVFDTALITEAYGRLRHSAAELQAQGIKITDDAMVVETLLHHPVKLVQGSYQNIKITTPEDLAVAETFLTCG